MIPYNPLVHRVSSATNTMELAKCARDANPSNVTLALDYQNARQERENCNSRAPCNIQNRMDQSRC